MEDTPADHDDDRKFALRCELCNGNHQSCHQGCGSARETPCRDASIAQSAALHSCPAAGFRPAVRHAAKGSEKTIRRGIRLQYRPRLASGRGPFADISMHLFDARGHARARRLRPFHVSCFLTRLSSVRLHGRSMVGQTMYYAC